MRCSRPSSGLKLATAKVNAAVHIHVIFHDVSAYFCEEEWTLLHEWQRKLYRNVMKEIHQALISLGPLIATTLFSLRDKESKDLCLADNQKPERSHSATYSSNDTMNNLNEEVGIERADGLLQNTLQDPEGEGNNIQDPEGEGNEWHSTGNGIISFSIKEEDATDCIENMVNTSTEVVSCPTEDMSSIFIDHLGEEVTESSKDLNSDMSSIFIDHLGEEVTESSKDLNSEDMSSILIDHLGEEVTESNKDLNSEVPVITAVFSLSIKPEDKMCVKETVEPEKKSSGEMTAASEVLFSGNQYLEDNRSIEELERQEELTGGNGSMKEKRKINISLKYDDKSMSRKLKAKMVHCFSERKTCTRTIWPECDQAMTEEKNEQQHLGFGERTCPSLYQMTSHVQRPDTYVESERTKRNDTIIANESDMLQRGQAYDCPQSEKHFQSDGHIEHQRTHDIKGRKFTCTDCGKSLSSITALTRHERTHTGERPYHCTVCGKCFSQNGARHRHQQIHTSKTEQLCQADNHYEHQQAHESKGRVTCTECGKSLSSMTALLRHEITHTGEKPFQCTMCGKRFGLKGALQRHEKIHTGNGSMKGKRRINISLKCDDKSMSRKLKAKMVHCFSERKTCTRTIWPECDQAMAEEKNEQQQHEFGERTCPSLYQMTSHVQRTDTYIESESTKISDNTIANESDMLQRGHVYDFPQSEKHFQSDGHTEHQRTNDIKGRTFTCSDCGKSLSSITALTRHERTHTGERPYHCTVCGKCFSQNGARHRHQQIHTSKTEQPCEADNHYEHQQAHESKGRVTCTKCGKSLSSMTALLRHEITHTGEKPFQCTMCGNRFGLKGALQRHEKIHKGERPYQCNVCEKRFSQKHNLVEHQTIHTKQNCFIHILKTI
ncbi:zinc finger protein 189-like isoform X4 [Ambystoma mexicanum]|uniref:zinc finger protein 189-like isoform X4 n=1 Tax=Ambystoma mexicanum TaxID=8296 RepID=UPI0037E74332